MGRREILGHTNGSGSESIEVLVRVGEDGTPIPRCEVLYCDADSEARVEIEFLLEPGGLDLEVIRRVASRTFTDDRGIARLSCGTDDVYALAVSDAYTGDASFSVQAGEQTPRVIDCVAATFHWIEVVDPRGRPQAGIPVVVVRKERGWLDFEMPMVSTTSGAQGIAKVGPFAMKDGGTKNNTFVAHIAGHFDSGASVEFELGAPPEAPIRIVLPDHGSVEVRIVHADGSAFSGAGGVELHRIDEDSDVELGSPKLLMPHSSVAVFPHVGLGMALEATLEIPGCKAKHSVRGAGPVSFGEQAVLQLVIPDDVLTLVMRALDQEQRPVRFRELHFIGAVELDGTTLQYERDATSDGLGNVSISLEMFPFVRGLSTVLLLSKRESGSLGRIESVTLGPGSNDLGTWTLGPAKLLANGRVVEAGGADAAPDASVELVNPERLLGIGWAEPSRSGEGGAFTLRGWSSEETISILAGFPGARRREPILVKRGATDVVLPKP